MQLAIVEGLNAPEASLLSRSPRYNGAPSHDLLVIRENHRTGERSIDALRWGLIAHGCKDPSGGRKPINAKAETIATLLTFRDAYAHRRCVVPVNGFYEWQSTRRGKQPFAVAMANGAPFALGGIWENWRSPQSGQWIRTFCIVTTPANTLIGQIHNRMPLILSARSFDRWLGSEANPADLLCTYPASDLVIWPISQRVNSPANDDPSVLTEVAVPAPEERPQTLWLDGGR